MIESFHRIASVLRRFSPAALIDARGDYMVEWERFAKNWNRVLYIRTIRAVDAARERPDPLARTDRHAQGRIRRVQEAADALRRLHGVRGHSRVPRHRDTQSAGPAARALEAHRRAGTPYPAPPHRDHAGARHPPD